MNDFGITGLVVYDCCWTDSSRGIISPYGYEVCSAFPITVDITHYIPDGLS